MTVTVDATKGWARPADAAEVTELFAAAATTIPDPVGYWRCDEASGNLIDLIGSLDLVANGSPLYAQSATGWDGTGVAATDNTTDGFAVAAGVGPNPTTTSQVWVFVMSLSAEPTANRVIGGVNLTGAATTMVRLQFNPSAGTNRLNITANAAANGSVDHVVGDYVMAALYDRAGSRAKAYSDLETVSGVVPSAVADGPKGLFRQAACGDAVCMGIYLWTGADAEGLDDTDIASIIDVIENPPAAASGSMIDFTIPTHNLGRVLLALFVRNSNEVLPASNASSWTKVIDGSGSGDFFLDGYARLSDGTDQSLAGDVISFASTVTQDLLGTLVEINAARVSDVIESVTTGAFLADANPAAPAVDSLNTRNAFLTVFCQSTVVTFTPPTGQTEVDDYSNSGSPTRSIGIALGDAEIVGEVDPGSATLSSAADGRSWSVMLHYAAPESMLTALQAGSTTHKLIAAIEGYDYLFTDATSAQAVNAWDGYDWTQALVGCTVNLLNEQAISPWQPFGSGGKLTLYVPPQSAGNTEAADPFGVDFRRKNAGDESFLATSIDRTTPDFDVLSATGFAATGTVHIGTEAIGYDTITGNEFSDLERGKWSPFGRDADVVTPAYVAGRFARDHRLVVDTNQIPLKPLVTEQYRIWDGRWIGLWLHDYSHEDGLLSSRADAQLVYAGRVADIIDDPTTMNTVVQCDHVLDYVRGATIGDNLWTATVEEGIRIEVGTPDFDAIDTDGTTELTANSLVVVIGAPASVNEIQVGRYTTDELITRINDWLSAEKAAGRLNGTHQFKIGSASDPLGLRTWLDSATPGETVTVRIKMGGLINRFLGNFPHSSQSSGSVHVISSTGTDVFDTVSDNKPLRCSLNLKVGGFDVTDQQGTFIAHEIGSIAQNPLANGIFAIEGVIFSGLFDDAVPGIDTIGNTSLGGPLSGPLDGVKLEIAYDDPAPSLQVRQVLAIQSTWADAIKQIFYSTGEAGYNHATHDALPAQLSLGIPGELLGDRFEQSVDQIPGALDTVFTLVLHKPQRIDELLAGSLIFRWSFLRWIDQHLEFCTWSTPTTGDALTEAEKAVALGVDEHHKVPTLMTSEWATPIIKVDYDRDILASGDDDGYRSSRTIVDRTAVDDAGGRAQVKTIKLRDMYGTDGFESLIGQFVSGAAMFTRAVSKVQRSMSSKFFEGYSVGEVLLVTDEFAGDPDTGLRGVSARPGLVIGHRWSLGGSGPNGSVADPVGEVDIMFKDVLRLGAYVPTAQVDETATNAGYVIATKVATVYEHAHSESTEAADATRFPIGAKVKWIEIDPADPASPDTHDDTIAAQSGNTLTMTTGFAGFDNTKQYRIVSDHYADASSTQQGAFAYQADTDGKVQDLRNPYEYVATNLSGSYTENAADDPVELPPNLSYGDGVGRDVGHEAAINRLINNQIDYKTAGSHTYLQQTEMSGAAATGTWLLLDLTPINLTRVQLTFVITRALSVAPFMKSSDGAAANVRVTIAQSRPAGTSLDDVDRGVVYAEATFTTTSTTYATMTAEDLNLAGIPDTRGECWLLIEGSVKARTYGLGICQVGARTL